MLENESLKLLLDKAPDLNEIYKDLAQPAIRKLSIALETTIELCNTTLLPIRLLNAKANTIYQKNIKKLSNELEKIQLEDVTTIPPELGVPILEKLSYTTNEEISNLFIQLLTKSSSTKTIHMAHPSYIKIIESISSDEAILLSFLSRRKTAIPVLRHKLFSKEIINGYETFSYISIHTSMLEFTNEINLLFINNFAVYIDNLIGLGLLEVNYTNFLPPESQYDEIDQKYRDSRSTDVTKIFNNDIHSRIEFDRGYVSLTQFGIAFIKACINSNQSDLVINV
ncbi:hypothetical protein GCM10008018_60530 [Paenibacillus marchantiophytorum]|uniref:DUF4393 domain-containing protein n=1 Tax=Paenibacillus marchantiophytorum TaxID=1619310 RepID=A0ABQ1FC45_9BACL|nr:DUF4393 domain-containing protein [Paenibacillus marchantiophytorum]GGA06557.1 hypothetical protein GCM10008018_60530 [Paenibacillus marchantiophytorum]